MDNEVFQKAVIQELKLISARQDEFGKRMDKLDTRLDESGKRMNEFSIRQDEMYQVVRSIEHSNNVGKAQLDSQNLRISRLEGKFKRVANVCGDEAEVSNL